MMTRDTKSPTSTTKYRGRIAFITTPQFRKHHSDLVRRFVYGHLYSLTNAFQILSTGRTYDEIVKAVKARPSAEARSLIESDMSLGVLSDHAIKLWRDTILSGVTHTKPSVLGMVEIAFELVEGRLDAVIHLTDWEDMSAKPDSAVLWREANVHNVPIAHDVHTAVAFVMRWVAEARRSRTVRVFPVRGQPESPPLAGLSTKDRVLAMIAHDAKKLEICQFAVENAAIIFRQFDYVLSTGTTGSFLRQFMEAAGRSPSDVAKIRLCLSGPYGGDVQVAYAIVRDLCRTIVFLQDPQMSHPHDTDIRLFEQAVLARPEVPVKLATNVEGARLLIEEEGRSSNNVFQRTGRKRPVR